MKTGPEMIRVDATPIDAEGSKLEPEERAAIEATQLPVEVNLGNSPVAPTGESAHGALRGMIGIESTAGDVAQEVSTRCELCDHWRRGDWMTHLAALEGSRHGRSQINALRGELLGRRLNETPDGLVEFDEFDDMIAVDLTIKREFGICQAFTESEGDVVATQFFGGCPQGDVRFKTRDREAQRIGSAAYDAILRMAQGR